MIPVKWTTAPADIITDALAPHRALAELSTNHVINTHVYGATLNLAPNSGGADASVRISPTVRSPQQCANIRDP